MGKLNIFGIAAGVFGTAVSLAAFADTAKADVCDCYFKLGDNVSDGVYMDIEYIITRGFLADISSTKTKTEKESV